MNGFASLIDRYPFLPLALIAVLAFAVGWIMRGIQRSRMTELLERLDWQDGAIMGVFSSRLEGRYRGQPASVRFEPGSKHRRRRLHLTLEAPQSMGFRVRTENVVTRVGKSLRLLKDVELGDASLDDRFRFSAAEPERFRGWMRETAEARATLLALVDEHGVDELVNQDEMLRATLVGYSGEQREPDNVRAILDGLGTLSRALAATGPARSSVA